jgi:hydroxymethylpyrimidine pyrophosphatase-like HAD family hydrolase
VAALGEGEAFDRASARVRERFAADTANHTMVLFIAAKFGKITEFFRTGTSKWNAFRALFPNAQPESVIAVGDEANDRDMIARAGLGIAMGNATEELKSLADRVTASHDDDGLALALEPLLEEM